MMNHHSPKQWVPTLLVGLAPGLLMLTALGTPDTTGLRAWLFYIFCAGVCIGTFWKTRHISAGMLPALGLLLNPFAIVALLSIPYTGGESHLPQSIVPSYLVVTPWLAGTLFFAARLLWIQLHRHTATSSTLSWAWGVLLLIYAMGAAGLTLEPVFRPGGAATVSSLASFLFPGISMILFTVTIGTWLVPHTGIRTGLVVVASSVLLWTVTLDYSYGLSMTPWGVTMSGIQIVMLLIVAPLWVIQAQSRANQIAGMLVPTALALVAITWIEPLVRSRHHVLNQLIPLEQWLPATWLTERPWIGVGTADPDLFWSMVVQNSFASLQLFLCLVLALILYHDLDSQQQHTPATANDNTFTDATPNQFLTTGQLPSG